MNCTVYRINRDYDAKTGFFIVDVAEAQQYGIGLQIKIFKTTYGVSVYTTPSIKKYARMAPCK